MCGITGWNRSQMSSARIGSAPNRAAWPPASSQSVTSSVTANPATKCPSRRNLARPENRALNGNMDVDLSIGDQWAPILRLARFSATRIPTAENRPRPPKTRSDLVSPFAARWPRDQRKNPHKTGWRVRVVIAPGVVPVMKLIDAGLGLIRPAVTRKSPSGDNTKLARASGNPAARVRHIRCSRPHAGPKSGVPRMLSNRPEGRAAIQALRSAFPGWLVRQAPNATPRILQVQERPQSCWEHLRFGFHV